MTINEQAFESRQNVFIINDIDLVVPPTAIQIQQEDLVYNWRTLRSKASTKIPTGHGQNRIHVKMIFKNSMLLDLHRLVTQFRHSPFCYIKNKYLRESLVPDWPSYQNMAFTMTSINVSPLSGTSDAWVAELDLMWFNYFPFLHNFVYREDWNTNWLLRDTKLEQKGAVKLSIGWSLDPLSYKKTPRMSVVQTDEDRGVGGATGLPWSPIEEGFGLIKQKTILDMESLHFGQVFDLLPMPGNMEPANVVTDPRWSRIYTRYINYLQRDAMIRNFGFNPEEMLAADAPAYFAAVETENGLRTYGLHSGPMPRHVRSDMISRMLSHDDEIVFRFHAYKDIRMPSEWVGAALQNKQNYLEKSSTPGLQGQVRYLDVTDEFGKVTESVEVREGWWNPIGKSTPCGYNSASSGPATIEEVLKLFARHTRKNSTAGISLRNARDKKRQYSGDSDKANALKGKATVLHRGIDIPCDYGTPVYAVEDGTVSYALGSVPGKNLRWYRFDTTEGAKTLKQPVPIEGEVHEDWLNSVSQAAGTDYSIDTKLNASGRVSLMYEDTQPLGTFIRSTSDPKVWYFVEFGAGGQNIRIKHKKSGNSYSNYMHLAQVTVNVNQEVHAGEEIIGYVGNTSSFTDAYLRELFTNASKNPESYRTHPSGLSNFMYADPFKIDDVAGDQNPYTLTEHLHFEYYEDQAITPSSAETSGDQEPVPSSVDPVLVDPIVSWNAAVDQSTPFIQREDFDSQIESNIAREVEDGNIPEEDAEALAGVLTSLNDDGWSYYGEDSGVTNLWRKTLTYSVDNSNGPGPSYDNRSIVVANSAGGLRHVVANIPLLSHEYPTQQHLGSMEPTYLFEFTLRDDGSDLEGIPEAGKFLQAMRKTLQSNARDFRPVTDAWALSTDTFITRLFGSYQTTDYVRLAGNDEAVTGNPGYELYDITKRTTMARSSAGTVEGNPGLSYLSFEMQETNPFDLEKLTPKAVDFLDKEEARALVLKKLSSLDFLNTVRGGTNTLARILSTSGNSQLLNPQADEFGQFSVPVIFDPTSVDPTTLPDIFLLPAQGATGDRNRILLRSNNPADGLAEQRDAHEGNDVDSSGGASGNFAGFIEVDASIIPQKTPPSLDQVEPDLFLAQVDYDISEWLTSGLDSEDLADRDIGLAMKYWNLLNDTIRFAEMSLAEPDEWILKGSYTGYYDNSTANGVSPEAIKDRLYDLDIEPAMWRSWQYFVEQWAVRQAGGEAANALQDNPTWMQFNSKPLNQDIQKRATLAAEEGYIDLISGLTTGIVPESVANVSRAYIDAVTAQATHLSLPDTRNRISVGVLTQKYLNVFPLEQQVSLTLDKFDYRTLFGWLIGDEDEAPRAFSKFSSSMIDSIAQSGNFIATADNTPSLPQFYLEDPNGYNNASTSPTTSGLLSQLSNNFAKTAQGAVLGQLVLSPSQALQRYSRTRQGSVEGFSWKVDQDAEIGKVDYFRTILDRIADDVLENNSGILDTLGLTDLADMSRRGKLEGSDAYPDLDLPHHPFFGNTLSTDPDFYMWNIYEDGGAIAEEVHRRISQSVDLVVENSYKSLKEKANAGGKGSDPTRNIKLLTEPGLKESNDEYFINVLYKAEGTDDGPAGAMSTPYYPITDDNEDEENFLKAVGNVKRGLRDAADEQRRGNAEPADPTNRTGAMPNRNELEDRTVPVRVALNEGYFGKAGGVQYPRRMTDKQYSTLIERIEQIKKGVPPRNGAEAVTQMFGTSMGFQNQNLTVDNAPELTARLRGTRLDRPDEFVHAFDPGRLKKLAIDSSKDIVSQKMTLKRAYPTFKLFFVEEDEFESRMLNFDDFHSYNAVQSFYIEQSRKSPTDTAVITIQNVSGSLDGTKRSTVSDLDYFSRKPQNLEDNSASTSTGDPVTKDTDKDQPFGAVVLRPGMNVQLRCGYSNDPDNLEVMLSGRVVDIQWNKNGDLAEILVQSFGVELIQAIKGTQHEGSTQVFKTTHQLLGSLMLEPELVHFGRWEIGKLFQIGESSDYRLDFTDYNADVSVGKFEKSKELLQWITSPWSYSVIPPTLRFGAIREAGLLTGEAITESVFDLAETADELTLNLKARFKKYFNTKKVSLFLSPQDDNLFPPHPKDYMVLQRRAWDTFLSRYISDKFSNVLGPDTTAARAIKTTNRWYSAADNNQAFEEFFLFDKRAVPKDYEYTLNSTTIWKTFHEMSLRHPGWIYAPRPYGSEFRYTMFFGVPSQRYWAQGASNSFVRRMNDLHNFLATSQEKTPDELRGDYKNLFGNTLQNFTIDEVDQIAANAASVALGMRQNPNATRVIPTQGIENTSEYEHEFHQLVTGEAVKEYLRGLNFRFVPFRRYHLWTSERDIVWNGIMSAENAVTNAVDVTYNNTQNLPGDFDAPPVGSVVVQAHSFIPQHQLRIAPVRWPNCKGYQSALRYGMGELLHRMRDMYRGEFIVLGNSRIRPWDIGVVVDSYNDMVGPVEVEQVVHSFSHETGFITEIKPSAVVIGNEISSWPILEGLKTFSMAVRDIEENYISLRDDNANTQNNAGSIRDFADVVADWGTEDVNALFQERVNDLLSEGKTLEGIAFNDDQPNFEYLQKMVNSSEYYARTAIGASLLTSIPLFTAAGFTYGASQIPNAALAGAATGATVVGGTAAASSAALVGGAATAAGLAGGPAGASVGAAALPLGIGAGLVNGLAGGTAGALGGAFLGSVSAPLAGGLAGGLAPVVAVQASSKIDFPGLRWLVGGPILFLQCMRQDSIVVVPLMKGGGPIVSGLSYNDPAMLWNHFRGDLKEMVDDTLDGTRDLIGEFKALGVHIWDHISVQEFKDVFMSSPKSPVQVNMTGGPP